MGPAGLPFSTDPRYGCLSGVPPAIPPPPIAMLGLYTSPHPPVVLPQPFYRHPVTSFTDELEQSSPELKDSLNAEAGRISSMSSLIPGESPQPTSSSLCQASYPSLLLRKQIEALHSDRLQLQQQVCEDAAANSECSRSTHVTPADAGVQIITAGENTSSPDPVSPHRLHTAEHHRATMQTNKTGRLFFYRNTAFYSIFAYQ